MDFLFSTAKANKQTKLIHPNFSPHILHLHTTQFLTNMVFQYSRPIIKTSKVNRKQDNLSDIIPRTFLVRIGSISNEFGRPMARVCRRSVPKKVRLSIYRTQIQPK